MRTSAILLAAPGSGSGKTTIACALMEALKLRGLQVRAFKCGPDYIDPMFHQKVIGIPSRNLDTFFSDDKQIQELFQQGGTGREISVVEGVMGLYDGLGGIREEGSAYHLAQVLELPVVLVLDAHGMGRTMVPLLAGLLSYDRDHRIIGVILNRTSGAFCKTIAPLIEEELSLPVFGYFPKREELRLESRHLGLKLPEEINGLREQLRSAAAQLEESVNVDGLLERIGVPQGMEEPVKVGGRREQVGVPQGMGESVNAYGLREQLRSAAAQLEEFVNADGLLERIGVPQGMEEPVKVGGRREQVGVLQGMGESVNAYGLREQLRSAAAQLEESVNAYDLREQVGVPQGMEGGASPEQRMGAGEPQFHREEDAVRIGIAKDEVFCFYYEDNLRLLREAGAKLIPFSPLHDRELPEKICGILLGGGYPELKAKELSGNVSMRESIRRAIGEGMPSVAECGGFLYLHSYMEDEAGVRYPMAGVLSGSCRNMGKLVRFGYVNITENIPAFLGADTKIKGHEFHYFDSDANGADCKAVKPVGNRSWDCIHAGVDHWWGFPHLYYASNPEFPRSFVQKCRIFRQMKATARKTGDSK